MKDKQFRIEELVNGLVADVKDILWAAIQVSSLIPTGANMLERPSHAGLY